MLRECITFKKTEGKCCYDWVHVHIKQHMIITYSARLIGSIYWWSQISFDIVENQSVLHIGNFTLWLITWGEFCSLQDVLNWVTLNLQWIKFNMQSPLMSSDNTFPKANNICSWGRTVCPRNLFPENNLVDRKLKFIYRKFQVTDVLVNKIFFSWSDFLSHKRGTNGTWNGLTFKLFQRTSGMNSKVAS